MFSRDEMQRAIEDALKTMEGVALELYRRGREEAREELEEARARNADMRSMLEQVTSERDEARAEVERLRETNDYLRTWLSSEELEGLRVKAAEHPLLWEEIHHLKDEVKRLREKYDSVLEANVSPLDGAPYVDARAAFRRGAEAMREACQQWFREHDESFELTVDACHDVIADMPIPEEP